MIEIENLTKIYPNGKQALYPMSLQISQGMTGLIGPNGAGKTTLMRILATLLRPTAGRARVYGNDLDAPAGRDATRKILGYLPQEAGLHPGLTVEQELDYLAILKGIGAPSARKSQVNEALERTGLSSQRRERIQVLSGGMKRRLGIAIALLGQPKLIIVDEPTAGLDPAERVHFRNVIFELAGERIVILSTHIVEDVSQTCQNLITIKNGQILYHGSPASLLKAIEGQVWLVKNKPEVSDTAFIISQVSYEGGVAYRVFSERMPEPDAACLAPTLDDAYLSLVRSSE